MRKVRLFCDWDNTSQQLIERLTEQTDGLVDGAYKDIQFVSDESYKYAMVFNFPVETIYLPKTKIVSLVLEPPEILDHLYGGWRGRKDPGIYSFSGGTPYKEALGLGFATVPHGNYRTLGDKPKKICMIASNKRMTPYHARRHEILEYLMFCDDLEIDFYGRGMVAGTHPRIMGEIPPMSKHTVLNDYKFCIDFENSPWSVITDKFFDPILCNTVPISNALSLPELVPENSYGLISFEDPLANIAADIGKIINELKFSQIDIDITQDRIRSGNLSMVEWIYQRVMEME